MASTFGSLNIAKTGLQYQQVAIDTANNNISNVNTDGYVRRRAVAAEVGGPGQPVQWSFYDGHGQGVTTQGVARLSDLLMDKRVRTEHGNLSSLQVQQAAMERVEATINEPSDQGVAHALSEFGKSWHDVVNSPDGEAARRSVIAAGQTLAIAINTQAAGLASEAEMQQAAVAQNVSEVNDDAQKMAQLNHNIFLAQANGSDVSDLEDQRDQIALHLANKAGAVVEAQADGRYTVTINGRDLVPAAGTGVGPDVSYKLEVASDLSKAGDPIAGEDLSFKIVKTAADPNAVPPVAEESGSVALTCGELGGEKVLLDTTLRGYRAQLNSLAITLNNVVNAQHQAGLDQDGQPGVPFFGFDLADPAGSLRVALTSPSQVAAAAGFDAAGNPITTKSNDASNADAISEALLGRPSSGVTTPVNINDAYQSMVSGLGSTVAGLNTRTTNQTLLANQVDDEREQTVGVSIDEETINLMAAQRAYQASSRVLSVMDEILDTLINRMGI